MNNPFNNYGSGPFGQWPSEDFDEYSSERSGSPLMLTGSNNHHGYNGNPNHTANNPWTQQPQHPQPAPTLAIAAAPAPIPAPAPSSALVSAPAVPLQISPALQVPSGFQYINVRTFETGRLAGPQLGHDKVYLFPPEDETQTFEVRYGSPVIIWGWVVIPAISVAGFKQRITGQSADSIRVFLQWPELNSSTGEREVVHGANILQELAAIRGGLSLGANVRPYLVIRAR